MPTGSWKNLQFYGQWRDEDSKNWLFAKISRQRSLSVWIPGLSTFCATLIAVWMQSLFWCYAWVTKAGLYLPHLLLRTGETCYAPPGLATPCLWSTWLDCKSTQSDPRQHLSSPRSFTGTRLAPPKICVDLASFSVLAWVSSELRVLGHHVYNR